MLPSGVREARERKVRAIRKLLEEHREVVTLDASPPRTVGCSCGWPTPTSATFGGPAYRAHLAERIVDA